MNATTVSIVMAGCMLGGIAGGWGLRAALPGDHLASESKDTIKVTTGLIATLTALVLGLLVSSANSTFNTQRDELEELAADIVLLDRTLALYGPESTDAREHLRLGLINRIRAIWPDEGAHPNKDGMSTQPEIERLQTAILGLAPRSEAQKSLQASAQGLAESLAHTRWLIAVQEQDDHVPMAFIAVLAVWTCAIFGSFSLFAPRNVTTITAMLICVLSVAGAVFLILELGDPYGGVISIPSQPLHTALEHLGK